MKKFMFLMISSLLLSVLNQAYGIRLIERSEPANKDDPKNIVVHEEKSNRFAVPKKEISGAESSGSKRILVTKNSIPSTTTTSKNGEPTVEKGISSSESSVVGGKEENLAVNSSPAPGHRHSLPETTVNAPGDQYPDIVDIAGMDYSPAKRKPPIHN